MKEKKNEHAKRMERHNSLYFQLMVGLLSCSVMELGALRREYDCFRECREERA